MDGRSRPLTTTATLFLALWPGAALREALEVEQARWQWPPTARPVEAASLHLTLHYLGLVPQQRLPELAAAFDVACPRFTLRLRRRERWRNGCAVLCPDALPEAQRALHERLAAALQGLQLPIEARPWRPHVTLARRAAAAQPPQDELALNWPVRSWRLARSLGHGRYAEVARYACG
jgi:2'-5' RNA ligase